MTRAAPLAAAVLLLAIAGGCRSDAPTEPWTRRDPAGPLGRLEDLALPGNFPAFERHDVGEGGVFWTTLDLDGDGGLDLVVTGNGDAAGPTPWVLFRYTGERFGPRVEWPIPPGGYTTLGFATADFDLHGSEGVGAIWRTVDVDGDRRPDLVITGERLADRSRQVLGGSGSPHWLVHRNQGDRFAVEATAWPVDAVNSHVARGFVDVGPTPNNDGELRGQLFDLDGDGLPDLVSTTDRELAGGGMDRRVPGLADGEPHWTFSRNTGAGFAPAVPWPVPDLNRGDATLGGLHATTWDDLYAGGIAWSLAELDGDGRPDLVVTSAPGLAEVPGLAAGDPHWEVHRNTGSGFDPVPRAFPVPALPSRLGSTGPYSHEAPNDVLWALADFDGDGRADLLQTAVPGDADPVVAGFPDEPAWRLHRNEGDGLDLAGTVLGVPDGGLDLGGFVGASRTDVEDATGLAVHSWRTADVNGDGRADLIWVLAHREEDDTVLGFPTASRWLVAYQRSR